MRAVEKAAGLTEELERPSFLEDQRRADIEVAKPREHFNAAMRCTAHSAASTRGSAACTPNFQSRAAEV